MAKNFKEFVLHLRVEALALAVLMVVLMQTNGFSLWALIWSFLLFDIGMIGYAFDPQLGSRIYNITHNYSIPTLMITYGAYFNHRSVLLIGILWTFHISVDRTLGYGLKEGGTFSKTHLGRIGKMSSR